ncbi:MAG: hypothetical protein AABX37_00445, partial [Nanoarchaeota archaeon]
EREHRETEKPFAVTLAETAMHCGKRHASRVTDDQGCYNAMAYTLRFPTRPGLKIVFFDGSPSHSANGKIDPDDTLLRDYSPFAFCTIKECAEDISEGEQHILERLLRTLPQPCLLPK